MQKKIMSLIILITMTVCLTFTSLMSVQASENELKKVDGSYLTVKEYSEGSTSSGIVTRGKHLMDGMCSITKSGVGKIYAYAATTANHDVDYLCAIAYVERYNAKTDAWGLIDAWQVKSENDYYVSTSRMLYVERGYYYRVRAEHICGNNDEPYDETFSLTDGIFIN